MDFLWNLLPVVVGVLAGFVMCLVVTRALRPVWVVATVIYFAGDAVIEEYSPHFPGLHLHWNWTGKLFSILFSVGVVLLVRLSPAEVGFTWPRLRLGWAWTYAGLLFAALFACVVNWVYRNGAHVGLETYLYQASMPGLDEELCFRGVGFALANRAFAEGSGRWRGVPAMLITTLAFVLGHGWEHDRTGSHFLWVSALYSAALGLLFGLMRLRSGSLLGPVVAHNAANTLGTFVRSL